jgi:GxxExxY protein
MGTDLLQAPLHRDLTERIIRAFYAVYNALGQGFLESVYEQALLLELRSEGLKVESQVPIKVYYKGSIVGDFRADLMMEGRVLVELKAARGLDPAFEAQVLNYLRATRIEVALLLNFGPRPQIKRLVFDNPRKGLTVSSV